MSSEPCQIGILFADIAGSTRLYETLGDSAAHAKIETCLTLVSEAVLEAGGMVVKRIGDEIMAAFPSATATFSSAVAMQRKIEALAVPGLPQEAELCIRVGFHFGPALKESGDFFGDTVNVAARMVSIAKGRQIITTAQCVELLEPSQLHMTRDLDQVPVRGKAEGVRVAEVLWREESTDARTLWNARRVGHVPPSCKRLKLAHHGREWVFDGTQQSVSLGREAGNDVVIEDHRVSRRHATIERRNVNWVMIDHSTNGTLVTFARGDNLLLRHAELILHGTGQVSFGHAGSNAEAEVVRFALL